MMSDDDTKTKRLREALDDDLQRLAVVGVVAPYVREGAAKASQKRVARVDKDGKVVGYTTLAEVQKALLAKHAIEIDVQPGVRPKEVFCERCGLPVPIPVKIGRISKVCRLGKGCAAQETCAEPGCSAKPPKKAFEINKVLKRGQQPWVCRSCSIRKMQASRTPEQRSEIARKRKESMTPKQRSEAGRKANASLTPEQRAKRAHKLSEAARKIHASRTSEQRSEIGRKIRNPPREESAG